MHTSDSKTDNSKRVHTKRKITRKEQLIWHVQHPLPVIQEYF